jgi:PAS domain S-box-containing protein
LKGEANAMTLRTRTVVIVGATLGCFVAVLYFSSGAILLRAFGQIEERRVSDNVQRSINAFNDALFNIDRLLHDWAAWDDTYEFIAKPEEHRKYIESNVGPDTFFIDQRMSAVQYFNSAGELVYGEAFDHSLGKEVPIPSAIAAQTAPGSLLLRHSSTTSSHKGIVMLPDRIMLVASQPILNSANEGPIRGTLIFWRVLDEREKEALARVTRLTLDIRRADDPTLPSDFKAADLRTGIIEVKPLSAASIGGYALLNDIYGNPALIFRVRMSRDIFLQGKASVQYLLVSLLILGYVIGVVIMILLQRQVIGRLTNLGESLAGIGESADPSERVPVAGRDELADIAMSINGMLAALERAQQQLRESENRFRQVAESAGEWIWEINVEGIYTYSSPAVEKILGYTPEEIVGTKHFYDFFVPADRDKIKREAFAVMTRKEPFRRFMNLNVHRDGRLVILETSGIPLLDEEGNLRGYRGADTDITERRELEEELIKHQKLESLGILAGGIAHDFNNILTAVMGYLSLIRSAIKPGDRLLPLVEGSERAALRAKDLTQQLLTFSKGGVPIKKIISLTVLLRDAASFATAGSGVQCRFSLSDNLWLVDADEGQISQVVNNLVINAAQAMPQGGTISITAANVPAGSEKDLPLKGQDYVRFSVSDEGIGIPHDYLQKIFDPYFTTKQRGSGLGLATCYSIVRNHDGMLTVQSELGRGSTFYVYLPAATRVAVPAAAPGGEAITGRGRVLIMDDEDAVREIAGKMLEHIGYEVALARDGDEMLAMYREARENGAPFAAVIMDLTISGKMSGKDAIVRLLALDPGAKAIVSSGYANDPIMSCYKDYGFLGVVPKPYRIEEIGAELRKVLTTAQG